MNGADGDDRFQYLGEKFKNHSVWCSKDGLMRSPDVLSRQKIRIFDLEFLSISWGKNQSLKLLKAKMEGV